MKVRDVMTSSPLSVKADDRLGLAVQIMLGADVRHLAVLGNRGDVIGVLSERDVLRHRGRQVAGAMGDAVEAAMSHPAVTVDPDERLAKAEGLMLGRKIGCLPVVEQGALVGMVTTTDIVRRSLDQETERTADPLPLQVGAVMKRGPAVVAPDSLLFDAVALMADRRVRHLPVVDANHHVVGMLSDRDVRSAVAEPLRALEDEGARGRLRETRVSAVMTADPLTVPAEALVKDVAWMLIRQDLGAVPVVNAQRRLVGIVSYVDVIRALL
jgi:CBS domain-containing protein